MARERKTGLPKPRLEQLGWMLDRLPPVVARKDVERVLGGVVKASTLVHDDKKGRGPRFRLHIGREVVYRTEYLLEYLEGRPGGVRQADDRLRPPPGQQGRQASEASS